MRFYIDTTRISILTSMTRKFPLATMLRARGIPFSRFRFTVKIQPHFAFQSLREKVYGSEVKGKRVSLSQGKRFIPVGIEYVISGIYLFEGLGNPHVRGKRLNLSNRP